MSLKVYWTGIIIIISIFYEGGALQKSILDRCLELWKKFCLNVRVIIIVLSVNNHAASRDLRDQLRALFFFWGGGGGGLSPEYFSGFLTRIFSK